MKQFLLNQQPDKNGLIRLHGDAYHYLVHVRRLKVGAVFNARLPCGEAVVVTVEGIENHIVVGRVMPCQGDAAYTDARQDETLPPFILFQALPKGTKMDLIIRQAAEIAFDEVVPFVSAFSVSPAAGAGSGRLERWRRIVKEARQQSGSAVATRVSGVFSADSLFDYWDTLRAAAEQPLGLIFTPKAAACAADKDGGPNGIGTLEQEQFHRYLYTKPSAVILAVGPEGGFSACELTRFIHAGFKPLSLGATVLRSETAALYGAAAAKIILQERAWWTPKQP